MIEIEKSVKIRYWTSDSLLEEYANEYGIGAVLYDYQGKAWEVFEDVNGDKFWAREVKK